MPYTYEFTDRGGFLLATASGSIKNFDELVKCTEELLAEATRLNKKNILLQETALVIPLSSFDAVLLARRLLKTRTVASIRHIAVIYGPSNKSIIRAFETVFLNRGLNYRMFADVETALRWLKVKSPNETLDHFPHPLAF